MIDASSENGGGGEINVTVSILSTAFPVASVAPKTTPTGS